MSLRSRGFTLIELMIALAVGMGVITAGIALSKQAREQAMTAQVIRAVDVIRTETRNIYYPQGQRYIALMGAFEYVSNDRLADSTAALDAFPRDSSGAFMVGRTGLSVSGSSYDAGPNPCPGGAACSFAVSAGPLSASQCEDLVRAYLVDTALLTVANGLETQSLSPVTTELPLNLTACRGGSGATVTLHFN